MTPLKRGDKVPVRVYTGEVVEAEFLADENNTFKTGNPLFDDAFLGGCVPVGSKPMIRGVCRLIGPPCDLEWSKAK